MIPPREQTQPQAGPPAASRPRAAASRRRVAWIFAGVVLAWAALTVVLGGLARYQVVCLGCHARSYASAQHSGAHESVACQRCHRSTGAAGWVADGLAMQRWILSAVTFQRVEPQALRSDAGCRSCHGQAIAQTFSSGGITVRHADFASTQCTECHGGTGHRLTGRVYPATRMDDCLQCHQTSPRDPSGCALCHVDEAVSSEPSSTPTVWRTIHGPNWQSTHGAGDLDTCDSCHPRPFCARCHSVRIPHPSEWPRRHGEYVVARGDDDCATCHDDGWCDRCHRLPMPHPDGFVENHPELAESTSDPLCARCHDMAACDQCHTSAHIELEEQGVPHRKQVEQ